MAIAEQKHNKTKGNITKSSFIKQLINMTKQ